MLQIEIKEALFGLCKDFVNQRLQTVQETISSNQNALQSETKSSAGDKHETGRAMLQLEMEKASQQLSAINQMKETLAKVHVSKASKLAHLGSVIVTNAGSYFLAISAGQLTVFDEVYFAISVSSPIGKMLLGKELNSVISFNNKEIQILKIF